MNLMHSNHCKNMVKVFGLALIGLLGTSLVLIGLIKCAEPGPEQLHCVSTIHYRESNSLIEYNVEEFVDMKGGRSSVLVQNKANDVTKIYYNHWQLTNYKPRQLVEYDPDELTCKSTTIGDWKLNIFRKLAMYMMQFSQATRVLAGVPIGPSAVLYAINYKLNDGFKYVGRTYSKARLSEMHVYSKQFKFIQSSFDRNLVNVMVHVPSRLRKEVKPKRGDQLSDYLDGEATGGMASIDLVGVCIMKTEASDKLIGKIFNTKIGELDPAKLDEDNFCPPEKVLFLIRYDMVNKHVLGSLMGISLREMKDKYEFHREPFLRPLGIGCWGGPESSDDYDAGPAGKQLRQLALGHSQFSATYVTDRGADGLSYIAYDKTYHLLRLEPANRKSVYDLEAKKSYHIGKFRSSAELVECFVLDLEPLKEKDDRIETKQRPNQIKPLKDPLENFKGGSILDKLLGLSHDYDKVHYLGMRMIDHVAYEVFECELSKDDSSGHFDVPIILMPNSVAKQLPERRMFVTFYARNEFKQNPSKNEDSVDVLKFVELHQFDYKVKHTYTTNRLEFVEFSWSLDVEPINDFESTTLASGNPLALFSVEPCHRLRSSQAELVVGYSRHLDQFMRSERQLNLDEQLKLLHGNREKIMEQIVPQWIVNGLEIRPTNLVDMSLEITPTGDMISTNRIVDLRQEGVKTNRLATGWLDLKLSKEWMQQVKYSTRHAFYLRDCQLVSIAEPEAHLFAHCPRQGICLILEFDIALKKDDSFGQSSVDYLNYCAVYLQKYSNEDGATHTSELFASAELLSPEISGKTFEITLDYFKDDQLQQFKYEAVSKVRKLTISNSIDARLNNDEAILAGLKHTTADREPGGINANFRFAPTKSNMDLFRQCQLACQMDNNCASFSVCPVKKSKPETSTKVGLPARSVGECILSSLRLTADRIASMIDGDNKRTKFELRVTNERESQSFVLARDDSCSLHPRDFLASYERGLPRTVVPKLGHGSSDEVSSPYATIEDFEPMSLEECAGRAFGSRGMDSSQHNSFTYCPLESSCLVHAKSNILNLHAGLECFTYTKRLDEIYTVTPMSLVESVSRGLENEAEQSLDRVRNILWTLDEQNCAYECNLHKANCLAFDICKAGGHYLCKLYSIRSPTSKVGAYYPLTSWERQVQQSISITLASSKICSHYSLRLGYFEVRLRQITDRELAVSLNATGQKTENEKLLDELEESVQNADDEVSKLELETIENELNELNEQRIEMEQKEVQSRKAGSGYLLFLFIGLLFGCLGAMFKNQISSVAKRAAPTSLRLNPFSNFRANSSNMNELLLEEQLKRNNEAIGQNVFQ